MSQHPPPLHLTPQDIVLINQKLSQVVVLDGYATCPYCEEPVNCGISGLSNLTMRHLYSKTKCLAARNRKDKSRTKLRDGSLLSFMKPKPTLNTPTVHASTAVNLNHSVPASASTDQSVDKGKKKQQEPIQPIFLQRLHRTSRALTGQVPEATDEHPLHHLSGDPFLFDNFTVKSEDLWEEIINPLLKACLGWGQISDLTPYIHSGKNGFGALVEFCDYFISERNVDVGLFEGKVGYLLEAAEKITNYPEVEIDEIQSPQTLPYVSTPICRDSAGSAASNPVLADNHITVEGEHHSNSPPVLPQYSMPCSGYILSFPDGQSPYSHYPFALHDDLMLGLPWDVAVKNGVMTLFSRVCTRSGTTDKPVCTGCSSLPDNESLQGIINRINEGAHPNAMLAYHSISNLRNIIHHKNQQIEFYRHRGLNQARKILRQSTEISESNRFIRAIASGRVARVDRIIRVGLSQKRGVAGILEQYERAAKGVYKPKGYTEEEDMKALLAWRLGGNRIAQINHRSRGDPSITYLRSVSFTPRIIPSHGQPTIQQVSTNTKSAFGNVLDLVNEQSTVFHAIYMLDELSIEKRLRWDPHTNVFLGVCREHGHVAPLEFNNERDLGEVFRAIDDGEAHYASEATVGALTIMCRDPRIYPARPVLVSGDCKKETGQEHARVIQTSLDGINSQRNQLNLRIVSIASDGEARRGLALNLLTFKRILSPQSPIHPLLSPLIFMNLHVGDDDITCDKDWKHVFKRLRNLLLRLRGMVINGIRLTPDIIQAHFKSEGLSADHIRSTCNPKDQQDVKLAFEMLKDIWTLPRQPTRPNPSPAFIQQREALWTLGRLLYSVAAAFLCVDFTLSDQFESLAAAAHLLLALYKKGGKDFIPTELYIDIMLMIKNAYFCVAKAKVDNPNGEFFLVLLGTDLLEELFGIIRTMIGNDCNADMLQLISRITGTIEVANILARYPHWDKQPRRLNVPAISRDSTVLPERTDHLKPGMYKNNLRVKNLTLLSSWRRGRLSVEQDLPFVSNILSDLQHQQSVDILSPLGVLLVSIPIPPDDIDESREEIAFPATSVTVDPATDSTAPDPTQRHLDIENRIEVEDALAAAILNHGSEDSLELSAITLPTHSNHPKASFAGHVEINGKKMQKAHAVNIVSKYRHSVSSTDRLRRVQEVDRYVSNLEVSNTIKLSSSGDEQGATLIISDPIVSLISFEDRFWLCVGYVNALKIAGQSVDHVLHSTLRDSNVQVSFQLSGLRPATSVDDPSGKYDWVSCVTNTERTFSIPGTIVDLIDPLSMTNDQLKSYDLFDSQVLVSMASSLFSNLTQADFKTIPKIKSTQQQDFPYREWTGKGCFLCGSDDDPLQLEKEDKAKCLFCIDPPVVLDLSQGQRILEHNGAHVLYDSKVRSVDQPCGLCLRPSPLCRFFLKKGKGAKASPKIDIDRSSGCPLLNLRFSYGVASTFSSSSPCTNVPITCPMCPKSSPAIWKYNLKPHFRASHPNVNTNTYSHLWELSNIEQHELKQIWTNRHVVHVKRSRKPELPSVIASDAHRARIPEGNSVSNQEVNGPNEQYQPSMETVEVLSHRPLDRVRLDSDSTSDSSDSDSLLHEDDLKALEIASAITFEIHPIADLLPAAVTVSSEQDTVMDHLDPNPSTIRAGIEYPVTVAVPSQLTTTDYVSASYSADATQIPSLPSQPRNELEPIDQDHDLNNAEATTTSSRREALPSARTKRKRTAISISYLSNCVCGKPAERVGAEAVLSCARTGCETKWYHLDCIGLEHAPKRWVCDACRAS